MVLSQSAIALAVTVQEVPNPRRMNSWVADTAELLTPQTEVEINRIATELEAKNGSEIAVVTVPTTKPSASSKAFATQLFNTWKIGKQGKNNGVLFLISKGDRRTEIETGTGLTALLPSSKVEIILTQSVSPQYKQGNFNEGTLAGTRAISQALSESPVELSQPSALSDAAFRILLWILVGGLVTTSFFTIYSVVSATIKGLRNLIGVRSSPKKTDHRSSKSWDSADSSSSSSFTSDTPSSNSSSNSSDSSSSSSSSSSDFGGGSSDGGGAGDSW
ncbi:TPM domain-containing protein [Sivoneniella epilithica]